MKSENKIDKKRFEQHKSAETGRGESEKRAIQDAAANVKVQRQAEGRSKK
jgi:hypothetical protein